jgi:hypothetical protein
VPTCLVCLQDTKILEFFIAFGVIFVAFGVIFVDAIHNVVFADIALCESSAVLSVHDEFVELDNLRSFAM